MLTIEECRALIPDIEKELTDEQVLNLRDTIMQLCKYVLERAELQKSDK